MFGLPLFRKKMAERRHERGGGVYRSTMHGVAKMTREKLFSLSQNIRTQLFSFMTEQ